MRKKTHIVAGLIIGLLIFIVLRPFHLIFINNFYEFIKFNILVIISSIILDPLEYGFFKGHHRQLHSIFILIIPLMIMYLNFLIGLAIFSGFLSHIILDLLNPSGCPLFSPIKKDYYKLSNKIYGGIKLGSEGEYAIFFTLLLILTLFVFGLLVAVPEISIGSPANFYNLSNNSNIPLNNSNITYDDENVHININVDIDDQEEKNITINRYDNSTTFLISNYDSSQSNV